MCNSCTDQHFCVCVALDSPLIEQPFMPMVEDMQILFGECRISGDCSTSDQCVSFLVFNAGSHRESTDFWPFLVALFILILIALTTFALRVRRRKKMDPVENKSKK